jgi:hypothetical protein
MRENLTKDRLARLDETWIANARERLATDSGS